MTADVTFLPINIGRTKEVKKRLATDDRKNVIPNHMNAALIFATDERLQGILAYDNFTLERRINRAVPVPDDVLSELPGPYPRKLTNADETRLLMFLQMFYSEKYKLSTLQESIHGIIREHTYHPVCSWLDTLEWDGQARLDSWLTQVYGVPLDGYHKAVGSRFLIAAVRRVRQPGCKFDQMIVFEGPQGIGKSSSLATLFGSDWFTDSIADLSKKESAIDLRGKWCAEFSEIEHLIHTEVETVKAFLSRSVDHYRAPYEKTSADYPRQCVLVGTTNATEYLRDATGNRRIWPIRCRSVGAVDRNWLADNRDQLWAEAAAREADGEPIWFSEHDLLDAATEHQKTRMYEDPWTQKITLYIEGRDSITITEILSECLLLSSQHQTKPTSSRVASILTHLAWENKPRHNWVTGLTERKWRPSMMLDI